MSLGGQDFFLMKLSASGAAVWTVQDGSASTDFATSVCASAVVSSIFVFGYTDGALVVNTNSVK